MSAIVLITDENILITDNLPARYHTEGTYCQAI